MQRTAMKLGTALVLTLAAGWILLAREAAGAPRVPGPGFRCVAGWPDVPSPGAGGLRGVAGTSAQDVWAVRTVAGQPVGQHWHGSVWSGDRVPRAGGGPLAL